nr:hypothetical protein [Gemmatimonadaceae bacterium]
MTVPRLIDDGALAPLLGSVRRRWRLRHVAVGVAITVCAVALVVVLASLALEAARFSPTAIAAARVVLGVVAAVAIGRGVAWPLVRRMPDRRLALYLEEREPQLDGA